MDKSNYNHGFSQNRLREILVDEGTPLIQTPGDGPLLVIKCQGDGHWIGDHTVFYTEVVGHWETHTGPEKVLCKAFVVEK